MMYSVMTPKLSVKFKVKTYYGSGITGKNKNEPCPISLKARVN